MTPSDTIAVEPVIKRITVPCDPQAAFDTFAKRLSHWWPHDHTVGAMNGTKPKAVKLEPHQGGRLYETAADGTETDWGKVREWQDCERIVLDWHIARTPEEASTVEVTFTAVSNGTEVVLTHTDFERLGDEAASTRDGYNKGWVNVFENHYAKAAGAPGAQ